MDGRTGPPKFSNRLPSPPMFSPRARFDSPRLREGGGQDISLARLKRADHFQSEGEGPTKVQLWERYVALRGEALHSRYLPARSHGNSAADRHCDTDRGRVLDVDLERRDRGAAVKLDANLVALDRHVPRDDRENLFLEHGDESALPVRVRSCASRICSRSRATGAELRPPKNLNSLMPPSVRTTWRRAPSCRSARSSRRSRPGAAWQRRDRHAPGGLAGLPIVTGVPRFEARSSSSLSGMTPSSGIDRISSTSSIVRISPRIARTGS